jgi:hypothetical protein
MTATQTLEDELTDAEPVKKRLGLCDRAFRELHKQGLPHYRINKRVYRYRWSEVEQWLANRRHGEAE